MKKLNSLLLSSFLLAISLLVPLQSFAAMGFSTELRNARATTYITIIGNAGQVAIFSGTRPATCGAATTELYRGTMGTPLGTVNAGVLTLTLPGATAASSTGTATWARMFKSDGTTCVIDLSVGVSAADLLINSTYLQTGVNVTFTSGTITEGNQ